MTKKEAPYIVEDHFNKFKSENIGERLNVVNEVIGDSIIQGLKVVFLTSVGDCGGCIAKGFNILKTVKSIREVSTYTVSSGVNTSFLQINYSYEQYIYPDNDDLIRKHIAYCYTPVLIGLDSNNVIISMYFPQSNTNQLNDIVEFVELLDHN